MEKLKTVRYQGVHGAWPVITDVCMRACVCACVSETKDRADVMREKSAHVPSTGFEPVSLGYAPIVLPIAPRRQARLPSVETNTSDTHPCVCVCVSERCLYICSQILSGHRLNSPIGYIKGEICHSNLSCTQRYWLGTRRQQIRGKDLSNHEKIMHAIRPHI